MEPTPTAQQQRDAAEVVAAFSLPPEPEATVPANNGGVSLKRSHSDISRAPAEPPQAG
eukprot:CAMPEP_0119274386 /NCGR_PEP_ID=MMETSP1329-20130426/12007_1 /TAXON_ID=114041 /ORGANISM="Genus nov. species nov., Strain RCC1024" /LENGTH=57 /DNA_ID=CAMNT_0007274695 /DNA_START=229 /DNA_END=398 /DNA_ORIENTATION=+